MVYLVGSQLSPTEDLLSDTRRLTTKYVYIDSKKKISNLQKIFSFVVITPTVLSLPIANTPSGLLSKDRAGPSSTTPTHNVLTLLTRSTYYCIYFLFVKSHFYSNLEFGGSPNINPCKIQTEGRVTVSHSRVINDQLTYSFVGRPRQIVGVPMCLRP